MLGTMGIREALLVAVVVTLLGMQWRGGEAVQFDVVHKYAHLAGSPLNNIWGRRGVSWEYFATLQAHHRNRRRLIRAAEFPLGGNGDITGDLAVGLYFTQISLGTPPRQFYVQVDTGSDVLWVDCTPCVGCPPSSTIPNVVLQPYDPTLSSSTMVLPCSSSICAPASDAVTPVCDVNGACSFLIQYGDGSNSTGYIVNDVFSFIQSGNATDPNPAVGSAPVYFGCGTTLGGFSQPQGAVGGLIGFGQAAVAVPTQLAAQGVTTNVFAHCLQGDAQIGGGYFIIGNISELGIVYTPIVPQQSHYNVGMQNIAVNGMNITTPDSFTIVPGLNEGVIMDSGTTLATLAEPAFTQFLTAVTSVAPGPVVQAPDGTSCWAFSGDLSTAFPPVTLFFDGGAVMNLGPTNYLYEMNSTAAIYQCMGWSSGSSASSPSITIWGDIVLKDQLVVYDNGLGQIGWKPFNCSGPISFSV